MLPQFGHATPMIGLRRQSASGGNGATSTRMPRPSRRSARDPEVAEGTRSGPPRFVGARYPECGFDSGRRRRANRGSSSALRVLRGHRSRPSQAAQRPGMAEARRRHLAIRPSARVRRGGPRLRPRAPPQVPAHRRPIALREVPTATTQAFRASVVRKPWHPQLLGDSRDQPDRPPDRRRSRTRSQVPRRGRSPRGRVARPPRPRGTSRRGRPGAAEASRRRDTGLSPSHAGDGTPSPSRAHVSRL